MILKKQINKMKGVVSSPKVMEIPTTNGRRRPAMVSGNKVFHDSPYRPMQLPEYFVARITTTLDGSTNPEVVAAVKDSSLSRLDIKAKIRP
ncbi:MAG: hypothetical protein R3F15_14115 [Lysobacterales bacterium]